MIIESACFFVEYKFTKSPYFSIITSIGFDINSLYTVPSHYDIEFIFEGKKDFSRISILPVAIF